MKIKPLGNRVAVEVLVPKEHQTNTKRIKLSLVLPDVVETYALPMQGKVIAVGNGRECKRMNVIKNDIVYFSKHYGLDVSFSGKKVRFLKLSYIMGRKREGDYEKNESAS